MARNSGGNFADLIDMENRIEIYGETGRSDKFDQTVIIGFPGSGAEAGLAWRALVDELAQEHVVVLFDTRPSNVNLSSRMNDMLNQLNRNKLNGPFILVAHSYGGYFAKQFLYMYRKKVAGIVLVETGKGGQRTNEEDLMLRRMWMGSVPLSVIRSNTLLEQWQNLDRQLANAGDDQRRSELDTRRKWLQMCDTEDENLEKEQLRLSQNHHYVHLPHFGHNVIRDSPDVVIAEVQWVLDHRCEQASTWSLWHWIRNLVSVVK